jgi:hypothetical protein
MDAAARYWLPRLLFQRGLALVYLIAFLRAVKTFPAVRGRAWTAPRGCAAFVRQVAFRTSPSIFYLFPNDRAFSAAAWVGGCAFHGGAWLAPGWLMAPAGLALRLAAWEVKRTWYARPAMGPVWAYGCACALLLLSVERIGVTDVAVPFVYFQF